MDLLVDPRDQYNVPGEGVEWKDTMAFLGQDDMKNTSKKKLTKISKPS